LLIYYYKDPLGNFGDDLNSWLWPKVFPGLFSGEVHPDPQRRRPLSRESVLFVGIGTLINEQVPRENRKIVFGSGVGYGDPPKIDGNWDFAFVRGPRTARILGLPDSKAIIDPAILAADYVPMDSAVHRSLAYMPHHISARTINWSGICSDIGLRFIDPQWPVDKVLSELRSTSTLLTEALHGAILAEAFRIPWVPVNTSPTILEFKWLDWSDSIGLKYEPARLPTLWKPRGTLGRLRHSIKTVLVRRGLEKIMKNHRPQLSDDRRFSAVKERLLEEIEKFSLTHGTGR
jgi:succinoglycan biosynthesis protein ExoV